MKKLIYIILGVIIGVPTIIWAAPIFRVERSILPETDSTYYLGTTTPSTVGWLSVITDELCLTGDSCKTAWPTGGGGAGTWATTTSLTAGQLLNYALNTTDIVMIGHDSATSSAEYWFDPNLPHSFLTYASSTGWSSSYASSTNSFFGNSTIGLFTIGGDIFDELVGTGLQITTGNLQTTLGTTISASEIADGDHGDFTYTTGVAAIDANSVALTTDTTGNYVSSATTNEGLTLTGTEGGSLGIQDCAANEIMKRNAGDTAWACATDSGGGSNPGGSGSELQFRSDATTFGAVTSSSVSGAEVTFAGDVTIGGFAGAQINLESTGGDRWGIHTENGPSGGPFWIGNTTDTTHYIRFTGAGKIELPTLTDAAMGLATTASGVLIKATPATTVGITIDGGGSAITTGVKGYSEVPYAMTITGWTCLCDQSGSIVLDVWKDTYANYPPTVADTIAGTEKPTLTSATKNQDLTLSSWTTAVSAGDIIGYNVDSITTVQRCHLVIRGTRP